MSSLTSITDTLIPPITPTENTFEKLKVAAKIMLSAVVVSGIAAAFFVIGGTSATVIATGHLLTKVCIGSAYLTALNYVLSVCAYNALHVVENHLESDPKSNWLLAYRISLVVGLGTFVGGSVVVLGL